MWLLARSGATCVSDMHTTLGIGREPHGMALHSSESGRSRSTRVVLALAVVLLFAGLAFAAVPAHAAPSVTPDGTITSIRVVRTAAALASVLGTTVSVNEPIDVLVDGVVARSGTTVFTGDYWFLDVPVKDGSLVQTRMSGGSSAVASVPTYVPRPVGAAGFIYSQGSNLMQDGKVVQLFGVDEQSAFIFALIASGLWGPQDSGAWGKNQLFPSGPETKIPNVSDADSLWREFFRYFLHYNSVGGTAAEPKVNLLRIWVTDHSWNPEGTYLAWKQNPAAFWAVFDRMVYWARQSGVYLVPVLGHFASIKDNRFFDTTNIRYAHQVEVVRAIMDHYDNEPQIAMWDLWNEPDVDNDVYWGSVGGITGFAAWSGKYIADVKPHSPHHLLTMGFGGWDLFPGIPSFGWKYHFFFNDVAGLDVSHHHTYGTTEDQYLVDWEADWHRALGIPHYEGEVGFNVWPGPSPLGYGYWPWYTAHARAKGLPATSTMVFIDNGKGPYTDYPYFGALPEYGTATDAAPTASFTTSPGSPLVGQSVTLDGSASSDDHGIVTYAWTFGDGGAAQGAGVTHAYATAGDFTATLTVTDTVGNTGSRSASIHVSSSPPADTPPSASFSYSPPSPAAGQSIAFDASASSDDHGISAYAWQFGDGGTAQGVTPAHAFAAAGDFTVTLVVTDTAGQTGTASATVHISAPAPEDTSPPATISDLTVASVGATSATLRWTAPGDDGMAGTATWYDFRTTAAGPITPANFWAATHYELPFFPHVAGSTEEATITGLVAGTTYWFALQSSDEVPNWSPASNSPSATIASPNNPPTASLTISPTTTLVGQTVSFDGAGSSDSDGTIVSFAWTFGDGSTSSGPTAQHAYVSASTFSVALDVTDNAGATARAWGTVAVTAQPADVAPPAGTTNLAVAAISQGYVTLRWTAPGDDGTVGQATWYDLRYSRTGPITEANFFIARHFEIPFPQPAGSIERATVSGLQPGARYWFALKASDEVPNWSPTSNTPSAVTRADTTPPATVTDLSVAAIGEGSVTLRWTAPGDDGTVGKATWYDLRFTRAGAITDANFYATRHYEISFPKAAGSIEQVTVYGLQAGVRYWFALKASDEVPNWSRVSNSPSEVTAGHAGPLDGMSETWGIAGISWTTLIILGAISDAIAIALAVSVRRKHPRRRGASKRR